MRILFLGPAHGTSQHRAGALGRIGHDVTLVDPFEGLLRCFGRISRAVHYRTGYRLMQRAVLAWMDATLSDTRPDLIWVDSGELFGAKAIQQLRVLGCPVVLYNIDDPTGPASRRRWLSLRDAVPHYDLCVSVREESVPEFYALGARDAMRVYRSYDEVGHRPFERIEDIPPRFASDIVFVGAHMLGEHRDQVLSGLIQHGFDISIWGDRWDRAPAWRELQPHWRGPAVWERDYVAAIQGAKIALGFVCHANRDLHTTRSAEIPYARGVFCAQRTTEHLAMYREGVEAAFWDDVDECARRCRELLDDERRREAMRDAGAKRACESNYGNEAVCRQILARVAH